MRLVIGVSQQSSNSRSGVKHCPLFRYLGFETIIAIPSLDHKATIVPVTSSSRNLPADGARELFKPSKDAEVCD